MGETYWVPDIHCMLEIVGRGGIVTLGLKSLSCELGNGCPVPQTLSIASSDGPVQPNTEPDGVTIDVARRFLSSFSTFETAISLKAGMEKARIERSPKTPTRAKPWPSNSVTHADSHKKSSKLFEAPLADAGLKIFASVWEAIMLSVNGTEICRSGIRGLTNN